MTTPLASRLVTTSLGVVEVATTAGEGTAVLVVHGTPGDWGQARALAGDLAGQHPVVLPTRPGYGRTPLRVGRTVEQQGDVYAALLDALGIDRAVVVGISGGGPSAYAFARRHAARCAALVLCCAVADGVMQPPRSMRLMAAVPGVWRLLATAARRQLGRQLRDPERVVADLAAGLTDEERQRLSDDPRMRADLLAFAADRARALRGSGLRNDTRQFARARVVADDGVEALGCPVRILHGGEDSVVPETHAHEYGRLLPGSAVEVLPGHGHALPITARDLLAATVIGLARAPEPPPRHPARPAAPASSPQPVQPSP